MVQLFFAAVKQVEIKKELAWRVFTEKADRLCVGGSRVAKLVDSEDSLEGSEFDLQGKFLKWAVGVMPRSGREIGDSGTTCITSACKKAWLDHEWHGATYYVAVDEIYDLWKLAEDRLLQVEESPPTFKQRIKLMSRKFKAWCRKHDLSDMFVTATMLGGINESTHTLQQVAAELESLAVTKAEAETELEGRQALAKMIRTKKRGLKAVTFERDREPERHGGGRKRRDRERSNECYDYKSGRCKRGNSCRFTHTVTEPQINQVETDSPPRKKQKEGSTSVCWTWLDSGQCRFGK